MSSQNKLETWNIKKNERHQAKKRKLETLLNLMESNKKIEPRPKVKRESLSESYKSLKEQLKEYTKKPEPEPEFVLSRHGVRAKFDWDESNTTPVFAQSLCTEDLYNILMKSTIGHNSELDVKWAEISNPQNVCRTVLLIVTGISKPDFIKNLSKLQDLKNIFPSCLKVVTSNISFAKELSMLHLPEYYQSLQSDTWLSMFPKSKEADASVEDSLISPSRVHLLLSPIQLVMENYPLPQSVFQYTKSCENYVFSKEAYSPVTHNSPMFAVDCEMCRAANNQHVLTRVAVVDENHDLLYHSLVKPDVPIVNYMTKYSGITEQMLENVTVTLKDVQKHIQTILPPDAILCGQSLNFDLHALRMIHPYVIDTSIIFNGSGIRGKKESLKKLTLTHLKEVIQDGKKGHDPIQDAISSMKLVQLKLENSIDFGDKVLEHVSQKNNDGKASKDASAEGIFAKLKSHSKKVGLIGLDDSLGEYESGVLQDNVVKHSKGDISKIKKATLKHMISYDLAICHLDYKASSIEESVEELNAVVQDVYNSCDDKTMFMMFLSGVDGQDKDSVREGLFFPVLVRKPKTV